MWQQVDEDKGRWNDYVNDQTGEHSVKEHKLKTIWKSCRPNGHHYELSGNREVTCEKCGYVKPFVLGLEKLVDGKLVEINI